jgi:DnaJ like chaperone protein
LGFTGTLLGGAIGWALGGPIGGIVGSLLGGSISAARGGAAAPGTARSDGSSAAIALAVLMAAVSKADTRATKGEVSYVKEFFVRTFGRENAADLMQVYRRALEKDLDIGAICHQIRGALDPASRVQLLHVLFGLATTDGVDAREMEVVRSVGDLLGISPAEIRSVEAMFRSEEEDAYAVLGAERGDSMDVIKKKYRDLAKKYHPDRVSHLGEEFRELANEKFRAIQKAYETIEKSRRP